MGINISIGNYIGKSKSIGHSFHPSLVDYWNFKDKSNSDPDRDTIKGVKGGILTARNLNWDLMSGYGGYGTNYTDWNLIEGYAACDVTKTTILIKEVFMNMPFIKYSENPQSIEYKIKVSGITNQTLIYVHGELEEIRITADGIYNIPIDTTAYMNFAVEGEGKCNILIEALPIYPGAIVTDGVDDNLIFNKTGYNIGTIIIRYKALKEFPDNYHFVFDVQEERSWMAYEGKVLRDNFDNRGIYRDYHYVKTNTPRSTINPFCISSMTGNSNHLPMALYEIAIYGKTLTDDEILKEIDAMNPYQLIQDYSFDKSNADSDRSRVYNKLNSYQYIELFNFGFAENSGYGLYHENYRSDKYVKFPDRAGFSYIDSKIHITEAKSYDNFIETNEESFANAYSVKITGVKIVDKYLKYSYINEDGVQVELNIMNNGIYHLPKTLNGFNGFKCAGTLGSCNILIEQLPEYPNHLVFDGIDDTTSTVPNFNAEEGTILIQYNPIDNKYLKFMALNEDIGIYTNTFLIAGTTIQARGAVAGETTIQNINVEDNVSAFAYDNNGIVLFNNGISVSSPYVNKHKEYLFGKDTNSSNYSKLAIKRIKIFDKKLTENQLNKEYDKLIN